MAKHSVFEVTHCAQRLSAHLRQSLATENNLSFHTTSTDHCQVVNIVYLIFCCGQTIDSHNSCSRANAMMLFSVHVQHIVTVHLDGLRLTKKIDKICNNFIWTRVTWRQCEWTRALRLAVEKAFSTLSDFYIVCVFFLEQSERYV